MIQTQGARNAPALQLAGEELWAGGEDALVAGEPLTVDHEHQVLSPLVV
jgi:hypothetical protein